jgi:branched-chain amino acid transport system substrate-binding protein
MTLSYLTISLAPRKYRRMRFVAPGSSVAPVLFALTLTFFVLSGEVPSLAQTAAQGVLPNEIVVGTHVDLSGPLKPWGAAVRNGLTMAIEESNKAGSINQRNVRLVVRDDAYDPAKAAVAARALAEQDRVFAILSPLGAPTSKAAMNQALSRGVLYLFPLTANEEAFLPLEPLKFAVSPTHTMEVQEGLRRMLNGRGRLRTGLLATADAFGRAVKQGVENELQRHHLNLVAEVNFAPGETEFETSLEQLRAQGTQFVVLGAEAEEAIAIMRAAAEIHWRPMFLCSSACYAPEFATLAGPDGEGLYSVGQSPIPYPEDAKLGAWATRYEARFSSVATVQALTAYRHARLFLAALRQAGPQPTQAGFARLLETRGAWTDPALGGLPIEFTPSDHLGSHNSLLAQIRRGRWVVLTDPLPGIRP